MPYPNMDRWKESLKKLFHSFLFDIFLPSYSSKIYRKFDLSGRMDGTFMNEIF